jgi:hypothetical protein
MKILLLALCMSGALIAGSAAESNLSGPGGYKLSQAEACQTSCKANADACRSQCSDPEEQEQCIVDCDRVACKENCEKFEYLCKQRCQKPGG